MLKRLLPSLFVGGLVVVINAACGGSDDSTFNDGSNGSSSGFGTSSGGSSGLGASSGTDPNQLAACATDTKTGEALPLDLYVMLDTSDSMNELIAANTTKYKAVADALKAFMTDGRSAGIGAGIQFFPLKPANDPASCASSADCPAPDVGPCNAKFCANSAQLIFCDSDANCPNGGPQPHCVQTGRCSNEMNVYCPVGIPCGKDPNGFDRGTCVAQTSPQCSGPGSDSCTDSQYATPAVAIGALPGAGTAIGAALDGRVPFGNTPTSSALSGAVQAASAYAKANAGHKVIVVLVTDGLPNRCDSNITNIANIAGTGVSGNPSIETFVVGVFAPSEAGTAKPNLDAIAAKGGTTSALIVQTGASTVTDFVNAMNSILGNALPCDYKVPVPSSGSPDFSKINVKFTAANGQAIVIPEVKSAGACGSTTGWYYDVDPSTGATPTKITLCPASCTAVKSGSGAGAKVDVLLGCQSIVR